MENIANIPVERLHPHPDNPRKDLGDLTELAASIKANGIFQNLTVVPSYQVDEVADKIRNGEIAVADDVQYVVIIGHRRLAAARLAGLREVRCVVASMTPREQVQTMLVENMQRSDLTVYEQAQGFQMMIGLGATVEVVARKTGFSETTIRRRLKMAELDQEKLKAVSERQISLGDFDKLAQIEDIEVRNKVLDSIGTNDFNAKFTTAMRDQKTAQNLPAVRAWLKSVGAKKIEQKETWSSKYETYPGSPWSIAISGWGEDDNKPPKNTKKPMFYYIDGGRLRLFAKREKPKKEKQSQEELALARSRSAAWKEANEKIDLAYTLRKQFVGALTGTKKNSGQMLWGALAAIILAVDYNGTDRDAIAKMFGLKTTYGSDRAKEAADAFRGADLKLAPKLVYAAFNDDGRASYVGGVAGNEFPRHRESPKLDLLYDWLTSLGYELSEDEKALRDGTHGVFKVGDEPF